MEDSPGGTGVYLGRVSRPHRTRNFVTESSTSIAAPSEKVRERITSWKSWPEWQSEIIETDQPEWREAHEIVHGKATLLGFDVHGRSLTVVSEEARFEQDVVVGVRMHVRYLIEGTDQTSVTHRLSAELPGGLAGRLLSVFLARRLRKMQLDLLRRLKTQVEELP